MKNPKRIQLSRKRGWRIPANTKKVDRTTPFGNPFRITPLLLTVTKGDKLAAQAACVRSFKDWLIDSQEGRALRARIRRELRGKNIGCWCRQGTPCHGDTILEIANAPDDPITVSTTTLPNGQRITRYQSESYRKAMRELLDRVPDNFKNFGDPIK